MSEEIIKISELDPLPNGDMDGFFTIGSKDNAQGNPVSYKLNLSAVKAAIEAAALAVTKANAAVAAVGGMLVQQTGEATDKAMSQAAVTQAIAGFITKTVNDLTNYYNVDESYSIEQVNELIADFITKTTQDLVYYYQKGEVYNKDEVDNLISTIPIFSIKVVDALPTTNISTTTLYLLRIEGGFEEYIYDETEGWVKLGEQDFDLSDYVRWDDINNITDAEIDTICV